jgi:hypothetical protein
MLTGKGMNWGGSFIRPEATGYGLIYFVEHVRSIPFCSRQGRALIFRLKDDCESVPRVQPYKTDYTRGHLGFGECLPIHRTQGHRAWRYRQIAFGLARVTHRHRGVHKRRHPEHRPVETQRWLARVVGFETVECEVHILCRFVAFQLHIPS